MDKQFRVLKSAQEHREVLLVPANGEALGLGIVALRDGDKYHQFRETLKCLLTLSAITQEQMRDRLLMLADIPPDQTALDVRALFGDDYDRIRERRDRLVRFKKNQALVERLVEKFAQREAIRGELIYRWTDLRNKRQAFEKTHETALEKLRAETKKQAEKLKELTVELNDRRNDVRNFSREEGGLTAKLDDLAKLDREFADFVEEFERTALDNLQKDIRKLEYQLTNAEGESRERARQRIEGCTGTAIGAMVGGPQGALIGAGVGAVARPVLHAASAYNNQLGKIPLARTFAVTGLSALSAAAWMSRSNPDHVDTGYYDDAGEAQTAPGRVSGRLNTIGASGDMVFGMHRGRHG